MCPNRFVALVVSISMFFSGIAIGEPLSFKNNIETLSPPLFTSPICSVVPGLRQDITIAPEKIHRIRKQKFRDQIPKDRIYSLFKNKDGYDTLATKYQELLCNSYDAIVKKGAEEGKLGQFTGKISSELFIDSGKVHIVVSNNGSTVRLDERGFPTRSIKSGWNVPMDVFFGKYGMANEETVKFLKGLDGSISWTPKDEGTRTEIIIPLDRIRGEIDEDKLEAIVVDHRTSKDVSKTAFVNITALIGLYLDLGISINSLIPELKRYIEAAEKKANAKLDIPSPEWIYFDKEQEAYFWPWEGKGESLVEYKFSLNGEAEQAEMVLPFGDESKVFVEVVKQEQDKEISLSDGKIKGCKFWKVFLPVISAFFIQSAVSQDALPPEGEKDKKDNKPATEEVQKKERLGERKITEKEAKEARAVINKAYEKILRRLKPLRFAKVFSETIKSFSEVTPKFISSDKKARFQMNNIDRELEVNISRLKGASNVDIEADLLKEIYKLHPYIVLKSKAMAAIEKEKNKIKHSSPEVRFEQSEAGARYRHNFKKQVSMEVASLQTAFNLVSLYYVLVSREKGYKDVRDYYQMRVKAPGREEDKALLGLLRRYTISETQELHPNFIVTAVFSNKEALDTMKTAASAEGIDVKDKRMMKNWIYEVISEPKYSAPSAIGPEKEKMLWAKLNRAIESIPKGISKEWVVHPYKEQIEEAIKKIAGNKRIELFADPQEKIWYMDAGGEEKFPFVGVNANQLHDKSDLAIEFILFHEIIHTLKKQRDRVMVRRRFNAQDINEKLFSIDSPEAKQEREKIKRLLALYVQNEFEAYTLMFEYAENCVKAKGFKGYSDYIERTGEKVSPLKNNILYMSCGNDGTLNKNLLRLKLFEGTVLRHIRSAGPYFSVWATMEAGKKLSQEEFLEWILSWLKDPAYYDHGLSEKQKEESKNENTPETKEQEGALNDPSVLKRSAAPQLAAIFPYVGGIYGQIVLAFMATLTAIKFISAKHTDQGEYPEGWADDISLDLDHPEEVEETGLSFTESVFDEIESLNIEESESVEGKAPEERTVINASTFSGKDITKELFADSLKITAYKSEEALPVIILSTGWMKGYRDSSGFQHNALNPLITNVRRYCKKMGFEMMICGDEDIDEKINKVFDETPGVKVVAIGGKKAVEKLSNPNGDLFVAGVDDSQIDREGAIPLLSVLTICLKLAYEINVIADEKMDIIQKDGYVLLIPKAEKVDPEELKYIYKTQIYA